MIYWGVWSFATNPEESTWRGWEFNGDQLVYYPCQELAEIHAEQKNKYAIEGAPDCFYEARKLSIEDTMSEFRADHEN